MAKRVADTVALPLDLTGDDENNDQGNNNREPRPSTLVIRPSQSQSQLSPLNNSQVIRAKRPDQNASPYEPLAKRQRSNENYVPQKLQQWAQAYIFPLVGEAVRDLRRQEYSVEKIVTDAVTELVKRSELRARWDANDGSPSAIPYGEALAIARQAVDNLKEKPCYQIQGPRSAKQTNGQITADPDLAIPSVEIKRPPFKFHASRRPASLVSRIPWRQAALDPPKPIHTLFRLRRRPYISAEYRQIVRESIKQPLYHDAKGLSPPPDINAVFHVDFTADEVAQIFYCLARYLDVDGLTSQQDLAAICKSRNVASLVGGAIKGRTVEDICAFCSDLLAGRAEDAGKRRILSLQSVDSKAEEGLRARRDNRRLSSLLFARQLTGNAGFGRTRCYANFQNEIRKIREDEMTMVAEFTNCAGDISTMTWLVGGNIICGTTAHSDAHNQQYNKQGNLLLCSTRLGRLRAFPDHRIPRPRVAKGENSTDAMRQSQDPWLYCSVVSSDTDHTNRYFFTSSFDKTVKIWKLTEEGGGMEAVATWRHEGNVNFVVAAKDDSRRVATAADVPREAVRIYTVDKQDVQQSTYRTISCSRTDADESNGKWAYFPATIQWGRGPRTRHLLAVGYSPRSLTGDESDIPEDKRNTGEILLWDAAAGCAVPVLTASTANVFEVAWHPTLPRLIAATSPCGLHVEAHVRTQVQILHEDPLRPEGPGYSDIQKLDCPASDINELTIKPNSVRHAYITAACTDGRVYVWDTAIGDDAIHVLAHGNPLDDFSHDREKEDTGAKFTAWGNSLDRFYTGSSDGVVKVWNVRNRTEPFVRNLVEAPGSISYGAFSPDGQRLAVGDATGRVFLFSTVHGEEFEHHMTMAPGSTRRIRRPQPFIPHAEPPPPPDYDVQVAPSIAKDAHERFLKTGQLVLHANPVVGAVQGPAYSTTALFRIDAHLDENPASPLLTEFARKQRESEHATRVRQRLIRRLKDPMELGAMTGRVGQEQHSKNRNRDLVDMMRSQEPDDLWRSLCQEGAVLEGEEDWGFCYEDVPDEMMT